MTASELQAGVQYVTEIWGPEGDSGVLALHSHMREPEPLPEPEPEAEL
jgi:hypothetical protein